MKEESGKWKVMMLICISMVFHFPLSNSHSLWAQSVVPVPMVNGDTVFLSNCHKTVGQVIINDWITGENTCSGFDGWFILDLTDRTGRVVASYAIVNDPNTSYIDVWDGTTLIENHRSGSGSFLDSIYNGLLTMHVHIAPHDSSIHPNINVMWYADSVSGNCHGLHSLNIHNIGNH